MTINCSSLMRYSLLSPCCRLLPVNPAVLSSPSYFDLKKNPCINYYNAAYISKGPVVTKMRSRWLPDARAKNGVQDEIFPVRRCARVRAWCRGNCLYFSLATLFEANAKFTSTQNQSRRSAVPGNENEREKVPATKEKEKVRGVGAKVTGQ